MVITQSILYTSAFGIKFIHTVNVDDLIFAPNVASESTESISLDIRVGGRRRTRLTCVRFVCFAAPPFIGNLRLVIYARRVSALNPN